MKRIHKKFGKKLRNIREKYGFTQEKVAKMSKISVTYYAGIERGEENPTFFVVAKICKSLNVKFSEILPF